MSYGSMCTVPMEDKPGVPRCAINECKMSSGRPAIRQRRNQMSVDRCESSFIDCGPSLLHPARAKI